MIPLGDENDDGLGGPAFVNLSIIALNILVFIFQSLHPSFTNGFSMIPREIATGHDLITTQYVAGVDGSTYAVPEAPGPSPIYLTIFTALFMHASILHIAGNMLFLYIFGDNIERAFGSIRYLFFYIACGVVANLVMVLMDPASVIPNLGASGAIAGVLAAYLVLFPGNRVRVLAGYWLTSVPAAVMIGLWIVVQFLSLSGQQSSGVAYGAHVGGFVFGLIVAFLLRPGVVRRMPFHYSRDG
jgi:membrane associated rhomboid family serine protease